jgi:hypothetical protein
VSAENLTALAEMAEAPEGSTPLAAAVVVSYLDADGEPCMGLSAQGDTTVTDLLGLLTWAQMSLFTDLLGDTP